jgi:hypothetical protein
MAIELAIFPKPNIYEISKLNSQFIIRWQYNQVGGRKSRVFFAWRSGFAAN